MAKVKTSITLDEQLVAHLDRQAQAYHISRSELIERLCRSSLEEEPKVEFFRLIGMPTKMASALKAFHWHDDDGPVELVVRVSRPQWEQWDRKYTAAARKKRATSSANATGDSSVHSEGKPGKRGD
jgi:hypothetical protein